ncbi:MAG TPA: phosphomannomutase/phosphoglucomutase [Bacteroidales bacterium]|nr:phosphomannomutase/phosphoglucomutase [Bacteroidales bacterium]HPS70750.1 phosphomannomutase/phosphoglucomutase [Bacteroidales bacterium]
MSAFKAYDFRGIYNQDFTLDTIYKFGYFLPKLLKTDKILIGRDMRISSPDMFIALSNGITDSGADVYDMGLTTTPMVYYFTAKHDFEGSVMITASHNPKEYNGLKVSRKGALPCGYDTGLGDLEKMIQNNPVIPSTQKGKIVDYPIKDEYITFLKTYQTDISNLKIAMDCSNGMGSILVKDIFGTQPTYIFDDLDGRFPNHEANPLEMENVEDLMELVHQTKADIGVIFDGDADRVMFVDEKGSFIPPDLLIAVMGHYFHVHPQYKNGGLYIQDIRTSKSVAEYLEKFNFSPYIWKVGRAFAALKLREIDGIFGGEFAGHYYLKDFYYSDSAMVASLIILKVFSDMKKDGISVSQLIQKIATYSNTGEINFKITQKSEAMEALRAHFSQQEEVTKFMDFDGYRIEFKDWWFNVRPSNTEPYLRLLMEAKTQELLDSKLEEAKSIIKKYT